MLHAAWQWFVSRPERPTRPLEIIVWWELRRIPYNLIVGLAGATSLMLFFLFITRSGELQPGEDAVEPMALIAAPFVVNICYTAGWVAELMLLLIRRHRPRLGPILLVAGTAFSLIVVFAPSVVWGTVWLAKVLHLKR